MVSTAEARLVESLVPALLAASDCRFARIHSQKLVWERQHAIASVEFNQLQPAIPKVPVDGTELRQGSP
jgi:hypothetical protein